MERTQGEGGLRIRLLGAFRVWVGSRLIPETAWRRRKAARLVKLLALAPEHRLHREEALELLWPGLPPHAEENNLHRTLHIVRHALDPDLAPREHSPYLCLQNDLLVLCPEIELLVDVDDFMEAANVARQSQVPTGYERAITLYAGDLLPEDQYEDWVVERREELRRANHALLRQLSRLSEGRGQYTQAIEALQRLVESEPAEEEAHLQLMRLYALSGQRHQALQQYERLREALRREVDAEPDAPTRQLFEEIQAGRFPPRAPVAASDTAAVGGVFLTGLPEADAVSSPAEHVAQPATDQPGSATPPTNLPRQLSSFVGREHEIAEVRRLLSSAHVLTLTGAGGVGKSRLTLEVAAGVLEEYGDGVWLVQLAALSDTRLVSQTVAGVLSIQEQLNRSISEALVDYLRPKHVLLILDNCEHLVETCGELAGTLLESCPGLRILATSRRALGIPGEVVWRVPSLAVPDPAERPALDDLTSYDGVALFLERARAARPDFAFTLENAPAVVQVCRRLEGIPLAIELAAARMRVLTVEQLAERLDDCFDVLSGGSTFPLPRHRTLRGTMQWSYGQLGEPEQLLFRRLAVFARGWTLEAAERICSGEGIEEREVLGLLSELVDHSLVVVAKDGAAMRYRYLEPVRQYAEEKLAESDEREVLRWRHRDWYLGFAEEAVPQLAGPEQASCLDRLECEDDNLRAALRWSLDRREAEPAVRLAAALWRFWYAHGHLSEGRRWLEAGLRLDGDSVSAARAEALSGAGVLACSQGDYRQGRIYHKAALDLWQRLENPAGVATALDNLGRVAHYKGDIQRAVALYEEGLALGRRLGDRQVTARSLTYLGTALRDRGDYRRAIALSEEALQLYEEVGDQEGVAVVLNDLGRAAHDQEQLERARTYYLKSLELWRRLENQAGVATALNNLGRAAYEQGDMAQAVPLLEDSLRLRRELGDRWGVAGVLNHLGRVAYERRELQRAARLHAESLQFCRELEDAWGIARAMDGLASVACAAGQLRLAAQLYGAATTLHAQVGVARDPYVRIIHDRDTEFLRRVLGERAFEAMWMEGQAMPLEKAVGHELAVVECARPVADTDRHARLTDRQCEVAHLVAHGLTNPEIAAELGISEQTVAVHVHHILQKLGVASRQGVANWARDQALGPSDT